MKKVYLSVIVSLLLAFVVLAVGPAPASAAPAATAGGPGCTSFYRVQRGDTLYRIALRFHTTVADLARLNGIPNSNQIYAGQTLCVRAGGEIPMGFLYTVQRGDTLFRIALRYGWSVTYLAQVNHLANPNSIRAGQVLLIPYH